MQATLPRRRPTPFLVAASMILVGSVVVAETRHEGLPRLADTVPIDIEYGEPRDTDDVLRSVARAFQLDLEIDGDLESPIRLRMKNVRAPEALDRIASLAGGFWVALDERSVVVARDTPQNRRTYEPLVLGTYHLEHADVTATTNELRALLDVRAIASDARTSTLSVRGTSAQLAHVERFLRAKDQATPEVELLVEIWATEPDDLPVLGAADRGITDLRDAAGEPAIRTSVSVRHGEESTLELGRRSYVAGGGDAPIAIWEGLSLQLGATIHAGSEGVTLSVEAESSCRDTTSSRNDFLTRARSSVARLLPGQPLLLTEVLPPHPGATGDVVVCGLLAPDERPRGYVITLTPIGVSVPRTADRTWYVGTEGRWAKLAEPPEG